MPVETKQDYAYRLIKEQIASSVLLPGQRIIVSRIAQEIGTSVIPVREALVRLESERLIESTPHIGAVVSLVTKKMVLETLETIAVLEGYATRMALAQAPGIVQVLEATNSAMAEAFHAGDWERFSHHNREFHFAINHASGNSVLADTLDGLWQQLDSYLSISAFNLMPDRAGSSITEHQQIIRYFKDPTPDEAGLEMLARQHKLNTVERLTEA